MRYVTLISLLVLFGCDFFPGTYDECWDCVYQTYFTDETLGDTLYYDTGNALLTVISTSTTVNVWVNVTDTLEIRRSWGKNIYPEQYIDPYNRILCHNKRIIKLN